MTSHDELETRIADWRGYVHRRQAISTGDVDELEDHLRGQIDDLRATGLDGEEAFLLSIRRLGSLDAISAEYAREHSERLWKQLVLLPEEKGSGSVGWNELAIVLGLAVGAGVAVKAGVELLGDGGALARNLGPLVFPFFAGYLAWKRRLSARVAVTMLVAFLALTLVLNLYPFAPGGSTEALAALHAPVALWLLAGLAYVGGRWRSDNRRMDFARFSGELGIYFALIALGGAVLLGLTAAVLGIVDVDLEPVFERWILPFAVPGALIVAAWLVEAKQNVVENIAPVLTKVFTPLTIVMLVVVLVVLLGAGGLSDVDRELLILMDAILILVLALVLYATSARDPLAPPGLFDTLQLVLVLAALAVDAVMLSAMLTRIAAFGLSPNKIAALGLNLLLLVHLVRTVWLSARCVRGHLSFAVLERWQTRYLPVYGIWAVMVVAVFPLVFGFA